MSMQLRSPATTQAETDPLSAPITVRVVDRETPHLDTVVTALDRDDQFAVERAATPAAALEELGSVECLIDVADPATGSELELLADLRERAPVLPYVFVAEDPNHAVVDQLLSTTATDLFRMVDHPEVANLFRRRVNLLVGHQRAIALANRTTTAIETTTEGIAIVSPDGTVQFANRLFAHHLGYTREDVVGRSWRDFFTDDETQRIESDALPSVAEGWRWVGSCVSRRPNGETTPVSTAISRLDDDSLVFTLSEDLSD